jgi:hypothetical protein
VISLLVSLYLRYIYGPGDLSSIKIYGQYKVGHRTYHVQGKYNVVSVYYPMALDREIESEKKKTYWDYPTENVQAK